MQAITGLPAVAYAGQGGLLDVVASPRLRQRPTPLLDLCRSRQRNAEAGLAGTAVARGRLVGNTLQDVQVIFRQSPKVSGNGHFGSRLVFARDGTLYIGLGERQQDSTTNPSTEFAQNPAKHLGKVVRIHPDGRRPHRQPGDRRRPARHLEPGPPQRCKAPRLHPDTGDLWVVEHGPQGGDELNRVRKGANFGWPLRSYGCPYGSSVGGGLPHRRRHTRPQLHRARVVLGCPRPSRLRA